VETQSEDPKAQQRLEVILAHLAGQLNATEAAQALSISRKTFYEWLERAKAAMRSALEDRPTGRPPSPSDPQKDALQEELARTQEERTILAGRLRIHEVFRQALSEKFTPGPPVKKKRVE
jgi:transposase